jgi:predicted ATPase/DNA-binding XRE family transcriptional regulator
VKVWEPATEAVAQPFGALLKRYRNRAGISQEALAEYARLSTETISALERGTRRSPYRDTIELLATALRLAPAERSLLESAAGRSPRKQVRPSLQPVSGPHGNLPLQLTSFVGRANEASAIDALMQKNRLVTLTGSGGVGKTRLALQVAAGFADRALEGAWFVELASLTEPALIPSTIAGALQCALPAGGDPLENLLTMLARKRIVLVLDNCEHLIAAVRAVAKAMLLGCPQVALLATSRQVLGIAGEAAFQVPPLSLPDPKTAAECGLSAACTFDAMTLFADRARAADSGFELTDQNAPIVADVCRRLDGIPLAIELAATRIRILSPTDLRDRLDARFRLLTGGTRDALPRQQTLRALIDWSYDLLDEREQQLFRRVGIFRDGFTLEAATSICGDTDTDELDVLDLLASLADKSLIFAAVAGDVTRYRLLESTRMYALEMLEANGERDSLKARHRAFFSAAVIAADDSLAVRGDDKPFAELMPDLENVRTALRRSAGSNGGGSLAGFAVAAARLFNRLGLSAEAIGWLEASLESVDPYAVALRSRLWGTIAYLVGNAGVGGTRAFEAAQRSVELARSSDDKDLLAWALVQYAVSAVDTLRRADAEAALAEAGELLAADALPVQQARLLAARLRIAQSVSVGDRFAALEIGEQLRTLYSLMGNESGELIAMQNQAENLHALGETIRAIGLVREATSRALEKHRETHAFLQLNLTAYLAVAGDAPGARAAGAQAIELLLTAGPASWAVATAIGHLALAHAVSGDVERAARLLGYWNASWNELGVTREFTEETTHQRLLQILTEHLNADEQDALLDAGAALTPDEAIAEALRS